MFWWSCSYYTWVCFTSQSKSLQHLMSMSDILSRSSLSNHVASTLPISSSLSRLFHSPFRPASSSKYPRWPLSVCFLINYTQWSFVVIAGRRTMYFAESQRHWPAQPPRGFLPSTTSISFLILLVDFDDLHTLPETFCSCTRVREYGEFN